MAAASGKFGFTYRLWRISPVQDEHNCFRLSTQAGEEVCRLHFSEACHPASLALIAAAPELKDIAEMYRDSMLGGRAEKSMVFALVTEVLQRIP